MKELADIEKFNQASETPSFTVELVDDKLDEWHVKVLTSSIDSSSELYVDLKKLKISHILLQIDFPPSFPFLPPFIRVISPSIDKGEFFFHLDFFFLVIFNFERTDHKTHQYVIFSG